MTNTDRIIKGLRACSESDTTHYCPNDCPYSAEHDELLCQGMLHNDALALVHAQRREIKEIRQTLCEYYTNGGVAAKEIAAHLLDVMNRLEGGRTDE